MPVYRFVRTGLSIDDVKKQVPPADAPSVSSGDIGPTQLWDITAPASSLDDLIDYMTSKGWSHDSTDPSDTPAEQSAGDQDHGELAGLGDDDHTIYHNDTRGDVRYYQKTEWTNKTQLDLITDGDHDVRSDNPHSTDIGNLGSGTLAELNGKVTDATLDDSGDPRDPNSHASSHQHGGSDEIATATPAANAIPKADGSGSLNAWVSGGGSGDVVGPSSATDEAIARYDGTTGKLIQDSSVKINDSGYMGIDTTPSTINPLRVAGVEFPDFGVNVGATTSYDNYNIGDYTNFNFHSATGNFQITGLDGDVQGKLVIIHNTTDYNLTIRHEDTASLTQHRFDLPNNEDIVLQPNGAMSFTYNVQSAASKWQVIAYPKQTSRMYDAIVAPSGGDYTSVKAAFDSGALTVYVRTGVYIEPATITLPTAGCAIHGEGGSVIVLTGTARIEMDGSGGVQETAGTVSVLTDSTTVTGVGTTFTNLNDDDWIKLGDSWLQIDSITTDTSLELESAWRGEAISGTSYIAQDMAGGISLSLLNVACGSSGGLYVRACVGISIRDCVFQESSAGVGTTFVDTYGIHLEQSFLKSNGGGGCLITDCNEVTIEGSCHFDNNDADGLLVNGSSSHIAITNSSCTNNDGDGVSIEGAASEITITNVICDYNNLKGLNTEPTTVNTTISSSIIQRNGDWGIDFDGTNNSIFGCIITNNLSGGIRGGDDGTITGCQITDNSGDGIELIGDDNNTIVGNRISSNTGNGINFISGSENVVSSNQILDNSGTGVLIAAGSNNNTFSNNEISGNTVADWTDGGTGNINYDEAIHPDLSGQIAAITEKASPVSADLLIIEDSAASNVKKRVQIGNLPGGGGGQTLYDAIVASSGGDYTTLKAAVDAGNQSIFIRSGSYSETATISLPSTGIVIDGEENSYINLSSGAIIQIDASSGTQETAGTVSVPNDGTTVTGVGTAFTNLSSGDWIRLGDDFLEIDSITSNTSLDLVTPWEGDDISGESYVAQSMATGVILRRLQISGGRLFLRACRDAVIEDVSISGSTSTFGLGIHDCFRTRCERIQVENNTVPGVEIDASLSTLIHASALSSNTFSVWVSGGSQHVLVSDSECNNNDGYGCYVEDTGTSDVRFVNTSFSWNNFYGFFTDSLSKRVELTNCTISNNGSGGVYLQCPGGILKGNVAVDNIDNGLRVSSDNLVANNFSSNNTGIGLYVGGDGCVISGNYCADNGTDGIFSDGDYNVFTGNVSKDNTSDGVTLSSATANNTLSNNLFSGNGSDDYDDSGTSNINRDFLGKTISAYDSTGGQTFTTVTTTINLDSTHFTPDSDFYSLASDQITVLMDGKYMIDGQVSLEGTTTARTQAMGWLENNTVEVGGTRTEQYLRQTDHGATGGFSVCLDLSANDVLRLRTVRTKGSGTPRTEINGSRLRITKVE